MRAILPLAAVTLSVIVCYLDAVTARLTLVSTDWHAHYHNSSQPDGSGETGFDVTVDLVQFGTFQGGGGVNWEKGQYGGGYNAGTIDPETNATVNGVGGGYTINATSIELGGGINNRGNNLSFELNLGNDGAVLITINSSASALTCTSTGASTVQCTAPKST